MEAPTPIPDEIFLSEIDDSLRVRREYDSRENRNGADPKGMDALEFSIKEFGLIQPLVVTWDENRWKLLAGGRRLQALKKLGRKSLVHGKEILIREELYNSDDPKIVYIRQAIELEENLKRKDMSWQEELAGKQALKKLYDGLYGIRGMGGATRAEKAGASISETGSSVRKTAAVLGVSPATLSQDLSLAAAMKVVPALAQMQTKSAAFNRMRDLMRLFEAHKSGVPAPVPVISYRVLVYVADAAAQADLINELEARGFKCDTIVI